MGRGWLDYDNVSSIVGFGRAYASRAGGVKAKDYCTEKGLSFEADRPTLQAKVNKVK